MSPGGPGSPMSPSSPGSPWKIAYCCDEDKHGNTLMQRPLVFTSYSQCPLLDRGALQNLGFPVTKTHLICPRVMMENSDSRRFYHTWGPRMPGKPTIPSEPCSPWGHVSMGYMFDGEEVTLIVCVHLLSSCSSGSKFTLITLKGQNLYAIIQFHRYI